MNPVVRLGAFTAVLLLAACQEPTSSAPTATAPSEPASTAPAGSTAPAAPISVVQWGAQETQVATVFNEQPDGTSGLWVELDQALPPVEVTGTFGDRPLVGVVSSGRVVTAIVPTEYLDTAGSYPIELQVPSTGARISVGTFSVKP